MVFFNHATRQMTAKIVYYGPGLCGKTTNLNTIYARTAQKSRGEMVSLNTETDRTLFFDLLPMDVGMVGGFKAKLQLYTVPGQVFYNSTRKLVLKGVDGIVFVADSQVPMLDANKESLQNLSDNLKELGLVIGDIPMVFQWNKRDLKNIVAIDSLEAELNPRSLPSFQSIAQDGTGVFETLRGITKLALAQIKALHLADPVAARSNPPAPALEEQTPVEPLVAPPIEFLAPAPVAPAPAAPVPAAPVPVTTVPAPVRSSLDTDPGQHRIEPPEDPWLKELSSFETQVPPTVDGPLPQNLSEALSFLDLAGAPDLFKEFETPQAPAPTAAPAGGVQLMAPLMVKLRPPQTKAGGSMAPPRPGPRPPAPRPAGPGKLPTPMPGAPRPSRPSPALRVSLPEAMGEGELEIVVLVRQNGAILAETSAVRPAPLQGVTGTLSVEIKRP